LNSPKNVFSSENIFEIYNFKYIWIECSEK